MTHTHRAIPSKSETRPFFGAVRWPENRAAHGGVTRHDVCKCGATRKTNLNGSHVERGAWSEE